MQCVVQWALFVKDLIPFGKGFLRCVILNLVDVIKQPKTVVEWPFKIDLYLAKAVYCKVDVYLLLPKNYIHDEKCSWMM